MTGCIFCKIVDGNLEAAKVWEDEEFLAILDVNPNTRGMTLVMAKKHYPSYAAELPEDVYSRLMLAAKKVSRLLDKKLDVKRTALVMEGLGVDHVHIKLYPIHGLAEKFKETWAKKKVFFDKYEGYITTQLGPKADAKELKKLAEKLRK